LQTPDESFPAGHGRDFVEKEGDPVGVARFGMQTEALPDEELEFVGRQKFRTKLALPASFGLVS